MNHLSVKKSSPFDVVIDSVSSDKSISHRCAIFSLLSDKPSHIQNFLQAEDTLNTLAIMGKLGATIERHGADVTITPSPTPTEPEDVLDCGNSGTGMRLLVGFLSALEGSFVLVGDQYLHRRPMKRVTEPLRSVGAKIDGRAGGNLAPLHIRGGAVKPFNYHSPIASAQVKSAMILSALRADSVSYYKEDELSRDHTERMLKGLGADLRLLEDGTIEIHPLTSPLSPLNMRVPADPSSAFFFAVAAAIVPNAKVVLKDVLLNKTRIEAYKVLKRMGADVVFETTSSQYEEIGDITVSHRALKEVVVEENISWLIDELPALSIAFACANGTSVVKNAEELRVKESDRIKTVVDNLNLCGIATNEYHDGYEVIGGALKSATINSHGDHRIAMSFAIAGLVCGMEIEDVDCINTSFPNFFEILNSLS
jgi:3-phosphoshikimate 1-carboxyvinyltransferase